MLRNQEPYFSTWYKEVSSTVDATTVRGTGYFFTWLVFYVNLML